MLFWVVLNCFARNSDFQKGHVRNAVLFEALYTHGDNALSISKGFAIPCLDGYVQPCPLHRLGSAHIPSLHLV
jgi:hypothetical protein